MAISKPRVMLSVAAGKSLMVQAYINFSYTGRSIAIPHS